MTFLQITGNGNAKYNNSYEGIQFKSDTVTNLSFEKSGSDLVIKGKLGNENFTYTIEGYDFTNNTLSNLNNLYKGDGTADELGKISENYQISYTPEADFNKFKEGANYHWNISAGNGIKVRLLEEGDNLNVIGLDENSTYNRIIDNYGMSNHLIIKNGEETICDISGYFDYNKYKTNFDVSKKTLYITNDPDQIMYFDFERDEKSSEFKDFIITINPVENYDTSEIHCDDRNVTIYGSENKDYIYCDSGNVVVYAGGGEDTIVLGNGTARITGGEDITNYIIKPDITGTTTITDGKDSDKLSFQFDYSKSNNISLSRNPSGSLNIDFGVKNGDNKEYNGKITVENFDLKKSSSENIDKLIFEDKEVSISDMFINVQLTDGMEYDAKSEYKQNFIIYGEDVTITNFDTTKDKISFLRKDGYLKFSQTSKNELLIEHYVINTVFYSVKLNYTPNDEPNVYKHNNEENMSEYILYLQDTTGSDTYDCTNLGLNFKNLYIMSTEEGVTVSKLKANDKICFENDTTYLLTDTNLTISDSTGKVIVSGFDYKTDALPPVYINDTADVVTSKELKVEGANYFDVSTYDLGFEKYDITGTETSDIIIGGSKDDVINGGDGNDTIYTGTGDDKIFGGEGNDIIYADGDGKKAITGGLGNDTINISAGENSICFIGSSLSDTLASKNFGEDVVNGATSKDTLVFSINNIGYKLSELSFEKNNMDLTIKADKNNVRLTDYFMQDANDRVDNISVLNDAGTGQYALKLSDLVTDDTIYEKVYSDTETQKNKGNISINKTVKGNVKIDGSEFVSTSEKGVTVNNKSTTASIDVAGSTLNDNITSKGNGNNTIVEQYGTNKITTGKGVDVVIAKGLSSNTINVGAGNNKITLESTGTNKITASNGVNIINATQGSNTIKLGNGNNNVDLLGGTNTLKTGKGANDITISDGINKVTTGKGKDEFILSGGNNTISSGAGGDIYNITDGYNTIKTGNALSEFNVSGGRNVITSGSKKDVFELKSGQNIINSGSGADEFTVVGGKNTLNGAAGDDTYKVNLTDSGFDFSTGTIVITDTKGGNILDLTTDDGSKVNLFFDVEVKLGKKGKVSAVYSDMTFGVDVVAKDESDKIIGFADGIDVVSKKSITKLTYDGGNSYTAISYKNIDKLAADIAGWLNENGYTSTDDVFANAKSTDDINTLVAKYTEFSQNDFKLS